MRPTEILSKEHGAIKIMLEILESACVELEAGHKIDQTHLEQMVQFIKEFADKCHHGKEEGLLFPAMQEAGIAKNGGPIAVMLAEHEQGRAFVRGLAESIAGYKDGDAGASRRIIENARGYRMLLSNHIFKEDNILFPMAERVLTGDKLDLLSEEFEKMEIEVIGPGRHEELHKILDNLKAIYLK